MPEIAEVARVTHFLRKHLVGKTIGKIVAADDSNVFGKVGTSASAFQAALQDRRVVSAGSQGKYFWLELDVPPHPVMHFGMTGWIHIRGEQTVYTRYAEKLKDGDAAWPPKYWKFHLETATATATADEAKVSVAFTDSRRFGRIRLVDCPGAEIRSHSPLVENGPDPVVDREMFTEAYFSQKMKARHVPVKSLLLDQAMISGIGNWVSDEIMYQAGLHPEQYSDDFSDAEIARLYRAVCYVCDVAVEKLGDSDLFPADWLFRHRWGKGKKDAGTTLPNGDKIVFVTVGGRTSCIVPSRQKKTGRVAAGIIKEEAGKTTTTTKTKKTRVKKETTSRFFDEDKKDDEHDEKDEEVETKPPPAKRARASKATKKEVKQEEEEEDTASVDDEAKPKKRARKTAPPPPPPPPPAANAGRRRSARLSQPSS